MLIIIKISILLFIIFWLGLAACLIIKFDLLFGKHPDDPSETAGARSLNLTQVWSCWFSILAIAIYFLFS